MTKFIRDPQNVINMSVENIERIRRQSESIDLSDINRGILELSRTMNEARWSTQPRILLELAIVKLSSDIEMNAVSAVQEKPVVKKPSPMSVPEREVSDKVKPVRDEMQPMPETAPIHDETSADTSWDYDKIWSDVYREGEAAKGSFYIIGSSAELTDISESSFTLRVKSEHVRKHEENNREFLEELMHKYTGKRRTMKVIMNGKDCAAGERAIEEVAHDAAELLGINVEIE